MNRAGCTLSFILSTLIASYAFGQELPFVHYTVDSEPNPLPSAAVNDILMDSVNNKSVDLRIRKTLASKHLEHQLKSIKKNLSR